MKQKRVRLLLARITTIAMILGCLVIPGGTTSEAASTKLKVTCPTKTVAVNCSITIKTNVIVTFKSSNKKIATVTSKGVVKGKKAGKVEITVTSKKYPKLKKTVKITVEKKPTATTEQATSEQATTEQASISTIQPNPGPTTEATIAQSTTEQQKTENPTTEQPSTETPTTEEPTMVGITAEYRGDKIPKILGMITK